MTAPCSSMRRGERAEPDGAPGGLLLVDKPAGMTSHDVVQAVRRKLGVRRIGHSGTLDPMATGLLILLVGPATKQQQAFQGHEKTYEATVRFGTRTDTGDLTGRVVETAPVTPLSAERAAGVLASLEGSMSQTPPAYSAVKVRGRPSYWWTRRHQPVTLAARTVHLMELSLVNCGEQSLTFRVRCSAGTYVRSLAEVIAERLGTVGHLAGLVRLSIGRWHLEDAKPFDWVTSSPPGAVAAALQPVPSAPAS